MECKNEADAMAPHRLLRWRASVEMHRSSASSDLTLGRKGAVRFDRRYTLMYNSSVRMVPARGVNR